MFHFQILGYLRRANTVYKSTDSEQGLQYLAAGKPPTSGDGLHLHFLKARNAWFENALEEAKNTESMCKILLLIYSYFYYKKTLHWPNLHYTCIDAFSCFVGKITIPSQPYIICRLVTRAGMNEQ